MEIKLIDRNRLIKIKEYYLRNGLKRILYIESKNFKIKIIYEITEYLGYKNGALKSEKDISSILCFLICKRSKNKESKISELNVKYYLPFVIESLNVEDKTKNRLRIIILSFLGKKKRKEIIDKDLFRNKYFSILLPYLNKIKPIEHDYIIPLTIDLFNGVKDQKSLLSRILNEKIKEELIEDLNSNITNHLFYIKWGLYKYYTKKTNEYRKERIYEVIKKRINAIYLEYLETQKKLQEKEKEKLSEQDKDILTIKDLIKVETNILLSLNSTLDLKNLINK